MCGLFGFVGTQLDHPLLRKAAYEAGRRGPNAWGVAWLPPNGGQIQVHTQPGKLTEQLNFMDRIVGEQPIRTLIGQSRLTTSGSYRDRKNNPPMVSEGNAIAHNGNVYNEYELIHRFGLVKHTGCDSEVISLIMARSHEPLLTRAVFVTEQLDDASPLALLAMDESGVVAVRRWQPIYRMQRPEGTYFSSRQFGAGSEMLGNNKAFYWSSDGRFVEQQEVK